MFLGVNLDKEYFSGQVYGTLFLYAIAEQVSQTLDPSLFNQDQETIQKWLDQFFKLTTYEISIPVLRDSTMAPSGKSGLIVSVLFDYKLTKLYRRAGMV